MPTIYSLLGVDEPFDPTYRYVTSWLLPPWALFGLRALMALYAFTTLFFILAWDGIHLSPETARLTFPYFTTMAYWGVAFYMLVASIHTFSYAKSGTPLLNRWPRPLQALHSIFYTTIVTFPFLVTIVFWILLYGPSIFSSTFPTWSNVSQHALNSLFALTEILLPRTNPPPVLHLLVLVVLLALYVASAYITYATQGFYVYDFLDPSQHGSGTVAAYAFGILAAIIVIFLIVWGLIWLRRRITERVARMEGKFSSAGRRWVRRGDDEQMRAAEFSAMEK